MKQGFAPVLIVLLLLVVATGGFVAYRGYGQWQQQKTKQQTVVKQVLVRRSKNPNVITQATTAKAIDVNTGKVITAARVFSTKDRTVYLSLDLDSPKIGTRIDYIRYLFGRYVDHGSIKVDKLKTSNLAFSWVVTRPLGSRPDGQYKIATYTNGILEKRVTYVIEKSKLSSVSVDDGPISAYDPDYRLALALARE